MIFVFGSNEAGRHGAGAAKFARLNHGAVYGVGIGQTGQSYAIPTKDSAIRTLPLDQIKHYVEGFIKYAFQHRELQFNVTRIGCGLAGYTDTQIAPMFKYAPNNCVLPEGWRVIPKTNEVVDMPRVFNKRGPIPANAVYVGRPTKFGNPFFMPNESKRNEVCDKFEAYVLSNPELIAAVKAELRGKNLVCWCSPARCHADTLLQIANT